jgi:CRISPR system Cascade subunit CasB
VTDPASKPFAGPFGWWASQQPYDRSGKPNPRCSPAVMARLRRVATLQEAALEPATLELHARLGGRGRSNLEALEGTALVAAVLAHVREDAGRGESTARLIGPDADGRARVSALRFRRILAARTPQETLIAFRRLVSLAGRSLPVADLAESLLDWTDPHGGDKRRRRWALDYYGAGDKAPSPATDDVERTDS